MRLILASASPRRRELLSLLRIPFDVLPVDVREEFDLRRRPEIVARRLAREKAEAARLVVPEAPVLAADTVVALDGEIFGKPAGAAEARGMLSRLRGRSHLVVTAVAVLPPRGRSALVRHPSTQVRIRDYSDAEIDASIARGDPFDKAGGYAIQDSVFAPVESYHAAPAGRQGCYCNVVGLPLWPAIELLRKAEVGLPPISAGELLPQCAECPLRPQQQP